MVWLTRLRDVLVRGGQRPRLVVAVFVAAVLPMWMVGCEPAGDADAQPSGEPQVQQAGGAQARLVDQRFESLQDQRGKLNETVWSQERLAQEYERSIVKLWDALKGSDEKLKILGNVVFDRLTLGSPVREHERDHGLRVTEYGEGDENDVYNREAWRRALTGLSEAGWRLEMTDWHHSSFETDPPRSVISANLYAVHPDRREYRAIHADLRIDWAEEPGPDGLAVPRTIDATDVKVIERTGAPVFHEVMRVGPVNTLPENAQRDEEEGAYPRSHPLIVYDLDGDGLSEVILAGDNQVLWNEGGGRFGRGKFVKYSTRIQRGAVIADVTGDGFADFVCAGRNQTRGRLLLYRGDERGRFLEEPVTLNTQDQYLTNVLAIAAGDIDGDGDLDLYVTQYKPPYAGGQMPTPYYDANDGFPSYLFRNDGDGEFTDITESAGLAEKRFRRTYSGSFIDIDDDGDLDLLVVSDFAGVDLYRNDGEGNFTDISEQLPERHNFGMAHTFDDFNGDGLLDFYVIGMSSTTARRLERMGLGREEFPQHQAMRMKMGYGNRMYLGTEGGGFEIPPWGDQVARTGWSWGTSSFDFDNDGDRDLYVVNGHVSGESTRDYCSTFWCHDIYTGDSEADPAVKNLFTNSLHGVDTWQESWDGYQKNVLFVNRGGEAFLSAAYPMGVAFDFDARGTVTEDLDGDGRVDLLVVENERGARLPALHILKNELDDAGNWIGVRLREHGGGFSPVGAKVTVHTPDGPRVHRFVTGDSFWSQHANTAHFGLGEKETVEAIEVRWPNGETTRIDAPGINEYHAVQPEGDLLASDN